MNAAVPATAVPESDAAPAPYRTAPIQDQIDALKRAKEGQERYYRKVLASPNPRVHPTFPRLESWRLESAIKTLEAVQVQGTGP